MARRDNANSALLILLLPPQRLAAALSPSAMLSPSNARPQQSARRAYVCLSCRLNTPRHFAIARRSPDNTHSRLVPSRHSSSVAPPKSQDTKTRSRTVRLDATGTIVRFKRGQDLSQSSSPSIGEPEGLELPVVEQAVFKVRPWKDRDVRTTGSHIRYIKQESLGRRDTLGGWYRRLRFEELLGEHADKEHANESHSREASNSTGAGPLADALQSYEGQSLEGGRPRTTYRPPILAPSLNDDMSQHNSNPKRPTLDRMAARTLPDTVVRRYHKQAEPLSSTKHGNLPPPEAYNSVRAQLRRWQEDHGKDMEELYKDKLPTAEADENGLSNDFTRLGDSNSMVRSDESEHELQAIAHFSRAQAEDSDDVSDPRFLRKGDLVEVEYTSSEKESMLAVFVRRVGPQIQLYTMQGRWIHVTERSIQYSVPGWVTPELVDPLIEYLPNEKQFEDLDALKQDAYLNDLSVPRRVAAPLVSRMVAFHRESQEIYRKHASALDRAHDLLAHKEDLRYGSLVSAATTLLKMPSDKLPLTALFTVRKALMHAGFAFNIDRRSHRTTGYLQIRSKQQVKMVEEVRAWLREWQDDHATTASFSKKQRQRWIPSKGAARVHSFIEKAKAIVTASRENRESTHFGNIGPSQVRRKITPDQDAVKVTADNRFNESDEELVRFLEAWACSNMFMGLPRINALPPLMLQATGLYEGAALVQQTGYLFLQELGTILPYENRVRFDQHLLLPSSQHSKPLQNLMQSLLSMRTEPGFNDSMADIRHDWGSLPVYCIDGVSAQEIDDGISVERANHADSESPEWWVHVHIANPTAFFDRDHPLAKMARHMGETIYTPERTYMMLPRWATQRHFSLAKERPCMSFSARMNERGETLENKIRAGFIRNVHRLTPDETSELIGSKKESDQPLVDITVGGDIPPAPERTSAMPDMKQSNIDDLKMLQTLAGKRQNLRKAAGGIFFDSYKPEMSVWQSWKGFGLAWDHPHRKGARTVEGDPVINMKTRGLQNMFTAADGEYDILVREMMLLACEVSTAWCADRQVPTIFRGAVDKPDQVDSKEYYNDVCVPAMAKNNGELPMHIGLDYIRTQGSVILSTTPLRHRLLGLEHYGKVTSPLRRYGDMVLHWQIEAALREEARTGTSLLASVGSSSLSGLEPDRSFLPFSAQTLQGIMVGLQPREQMITRAKGFAESFWVSMLLFRAFHFGEAKLPFETCHGYIMDRTYKHQTTTMVILEELNVPAVMRRPEKMGTGLPVPQAGDRWECAIEEVNPYSRRITLTPIRLASRWE